MLQVSKLIMPRIAKANIVEQNLDDMVMKMSVPCLSGFPHHCYYHGGFGGKFLGKMTSMGKIGKGEQTNKTMEVSEPNSAVM